MFDTRWLTVCLFAGLLPACGDDTTCSTSGYPPAPQGASDIVYVSAGCPADEADGSADKPYPSIQQGLDQAPDGAAVVVHGGTYPENLRIRKPVQVIGSGEGSSADDAAIIVQAPEPIAVFIDGATGVTLRGIIVQSPVQVGVWLKGGEATIEGSRVTGAMPDAAGDFGYGLLATDDGSIIVQRNELSGSLGAGLAMTGARGIIVQNAIRDNRGQGGIHIDAAPAEVTVQENEIVANGLSGVSVYGSRAIIVQNQISDTAMDLASQVGYGVLVSELVQDDMTILPADVRLEGNMVSGNSRVGVLYSGEAKGIIVQNQIRDNGREAQNGVFGAGVWVQRGAGGTDGLMIQENDIGGNYCIGIGLTSAARAIIVQNTGITDTVAATIFNGVQEVTIGDGIGLFEGAFGRIEDNPAIRGNGRFGLVLDAADAQTTLSGNTITDNEQYGIIVQNQPAAPDLSTNTFMGNGAGDTWVQAPGDMPFGISSADLPQQ